VLHSAFCILHWAAPAPAAAQDLIGQPVVEIVVEQEGQRIADPAILDLIETHMGAPLAMADVRQTIDHFDSTRRYDDITPIAEAAPGGARIRWLLVPSHPIDTIRFTGNVSLSEGDLRRVVTDRFGRTPNPNRVLDAVAALAAEYRRRGYPAARITQRVDITHDPHRSTLTFNIEAGRRARIAEVSYRYTDAGEADVKYPLPEFRVGDVYDELKVEEVCLQWEERMRAQGFYEATAGCRAIQEDDAFLFVNVRRGPLVVVEFSGDPLPAKEQEELVPIRAEASTDEDLLEDAELAIERYLHAGGYRDAQVNRTRDDTTPGRLTIRFQVTRGPRYTVDSVRIMGNTAIQTADLADILMISRGDLFVAAALDERRAAIEAAYIQRGFRRPTVKTDAPSLPNESPGSSERRVEVIVAVDEGPRTTVRSVSFRGNSAFTESQLRGEVPAAVGARYLLSEVTEGRDKIAIRYQNQGYLDVTVREETAFADNDTQADITYSIAEGQQAIVEHIIIVGNDKTKTETILEELEFQEGQPLGRAAQDNSRARLARLGLFRQVTFTLLEHSGDSRRDILIEIQEADRTTLGYSFGLEGALRARPTGPGGAAEDHLEIAPRGGFEIGRRNLWGTNRSVNLFTRVSLRSTDVRSSDPTSVDQTESNPGFNEYRVVGSFREPRFMSSRSELLITGIVEQAIRTTFNFSRRIARAEVATSVTPAVSLTGRYTFERTKLFDEIFAPDEKPLLIDKLFPEVRLSKFAGSFIFDTRDDLLDPSTGTTFLLDTDVAMRAIGSEVGFLRTFAQAYVYRQLPSQRRIVAAFGARLGAARGFERIKDDQLVSDLPASERFFAGGDTTVRGFSLDRLVNDDTVSPTGFPLGGNGVVVLNGELRVHIGKALHGVGFVDAGTVSKFASDLSLADLRPAAGAGLRIESPFGPIRLDLGVNLDPKDFTGVSPERRTVFHISIGQAF
jgi:outer membrane protein assembly complex protein YaeT